MTVVDRPDNGQDEGRPGYVKVGQYWVPIEPLQLHYPSGCCGAADATTCHQRGLCWMQGVHPDSPGFASGRAGAGEQQRERAARYIALLLGADRDFPSPATLSAGRYHLAELLALLGGPPPDGEARQHRMDADCPCQPVQADNGAWDHQ